MPPNLSSLTDCFRRGSYDITKHGYIEMANDGIAIADLELAIGSDAPEVIKDYPDDRYGSSCLMLAWPTPSTAIHAVVAYWSESPILVTAYKPSRDLWEEDFKTRRRQVR